MDFRDALRGRRIVRNYRTEPIPYEVLERVVKVVHRAPSAGFSQGHRLVVVTDPGARAALAAVAEPWYLANGFEPRRRRPGRGDHARLSGRRPGGAHGQAGQAPQAARRARYLASLSALVAACAKRRPGVGS
ncbi:nitroreductase family protein [Paractinoplanes lichenicola]|uniref:Nitroreductase family protein n=1 Tax=Paractinoplanes lichenicola TaxID=2802976 RepID=A0ABS1VFX4_9ACTN|nr:nitroreductase family protein [Actinoplanes lichenicola]MBL7253563.1 nitroreductase family protein [Actinoplanes lichenicola]